MIAFNRWEVGDPYEEFYKLESFARELSVPYCIGQKEIDGMKRRCKLAFEDYDEFRRSVPVWYAEWGVSGRKSVSGDL